MDEDTFRGKRVLVTGHTGFKGSWLVLWLERLGARVTGFGLPPDGAPNLFDALGLAPRIDHIPGDVRNFHAVHAAVRRARPEFVFHLAAQAIVRRSYRDPKTTFDTNVGGTVNVLEAVRRADCARVFINVTSDKCYAPRNGSADEVWGHRENDPLGGDDPYSASKACAELVFAAYQKSFFRSGMGLASVRAGNVIGGGDWSEDRLVPDTVRALAAKQPVILRNPDAVRPWQHVLEPLGGYLMLARRLAEAPAGWSGAWNFGPPGSHHYRVRDVVEAMTRAWGSGRWQPMNPGPESAPAETVTLRLSAEKAMIRLGWRPVWGFRRSVALTARWYREFYREPSLAERVCHGQIDAYERRSLDTLSEPKPESPRPEESPAGRPAGTPAEPSGRLSRAQPAPQPRQSSGRPVRAADDVQPPVGSTVLATCEGDHAR